MWPPAGTKARSMVVAEFIPEDDTRQSSAPSSSLSFSSTTRVVGLPYLSAVTTKTSATIHVLMRTRGAKLSVLCVCRLEQQLVGQQLICMGLLSWACNQVTIQTGQLNRRFWHAADQAQEWTRQHYAGRHHREPGTCHTHRTHSVLLGML